jgi:hypothetical protein
MSYLATFTFLYVGVVVAWSWWRGLKLYDRLGGALDKFPSRFGFRFGTFRWILSMPDTYQFKKELLASQSEQMRNELADYVRKSRIASRIGLLLFLVLLFVEGPLRPALSKLLNLAPGLGG